MELVRERVYCRTNQEVPYRVDVSVTSWQEFDNGSVRVEVELLARQRSHVQMLVGGGGQAVKSIGQGAREELTKALRRQVHLFVRVKYRPLTAR